MISGLPKTTAVNTFLTVCFAFKTRFAKSGKISIVFSSLLLDRLLRWLTETGDRTNSLRTGRDIPAVFTPKAKCASPDQTLWGTRPWS
ncbi:hypothetical protein [Roseobacter sp. MH60115]|uniref:hypothetical protein n=1 Tax=Roseobacter sp. MH60115 TaxID=2785324 RepID=UPI0018A2CDC1|nr:hypothetical protein [Roseobacter sp. MH60115]